ncbi:MAG: hypothetical protein IPK14_01465 [Blastocatellia bacterium]|nr:hypothetical protein [Blastocatellia bacterium]
MAANLDLYKTTINTPLVFADKTLQDLLPWYINSEKETLVSLESALENKDLALLIYLGDMLYGHGASFGFPLVSKIGKSIEQAATKKIILYLLLL